MIQVVSEVMSTRPVMVKSNEHVADVVHTAEREQSHFVLVLADVELVGVASICELKRFRRNDPVGRYARTPLVALEQNDPVDLALRLITSFWTGCVVVVDSSGIVCGTITRPDLIFARLLPEVRGVNSCMTCASSEHLLASDIGQTAFCCECLEASRERSRISTDYGFVRAT